MKKQPKLLSARITFLEMRKRPAHFAPAPSGQALALMRAENCPVHFYRYLYERVGRPHHWHKSRKQSDAQLAAVLRAPETILQILYCGGCPAGFAQTILRDTGEGREAELMYFGLMKEYQGRGLARFFLSEALAAGWNADIEKIRIQTNSLDSPRALQLYQQAGFEPVGAENTEIEAWQ